MKSTREHTPGPWKVLRGDWSEDGNARYELEGISTICAADAYLIAAAPDLLKVALEALAVIRVIKPPKNGNGTIVRLEDAIAKATGA